MNNYELLHTLQSTKQIIFTPQQIADLIHITVPSSYVRINRMIKKSLIYPIIKGKVSISDDPFLVPTQLVFPAFFSLSTALYLHGRFDQTINELYVLTSRKVHSPIRIASMNIHFIIINPRLIYGYHRITRESSYILVADIEKAIIDYLYLTRFGNLQDLIFVIKSGINLLLLETYAKRTQKEVVIRRIGYLLDQLGIESSLKKTTSTLYKLNPHQINKGILNKKWQLYINEELDF